MTSSDSAPFLVCGLGSLGQYCVAMLKEFGVRVNAIDAINKGYWDIPDLPDALDKLLIGDCRQPNVLEQAEIRQCRAVLLVTSDERVNIEAAFAARSLNPQARLVVRSAQENLNELLAQQLKNFVAFEATQLPTAAFALGALGGETRGFFTLENNLLRVIRTEIDSQHRWCNQRQLHELNSPNRRVLGHTTATDTLPKSFYRWEPSTRVKAGDTVVYIEATQEAASRPVKSARSIAPPFWQRVSRRITRRNLTHMLEQFRQAIRQNQTRQVAVVCGLVMLTLFILGTVLYKLQYPDISIQDALNVALVLAIGGYDNLFGQLKVPFPVPWWLHLFSISLTVAGTVFVGILYALLTERVLASRFQFLRRPPIPTQDHVVLVGLGRVGQRVAALLQDLKQGVVGISTTPLEVGILQQLPLIVGDLRNALNKANLSTAKSVIVLTDDEVANLELGLMAYAANPNINLVIRAFDPLFSENVARLLPYAKVLGAYELAAEAFAAAAFGENVLNLFRLNNQTTLVTEYQVTADDSLVGRLLAEVAYGYGVVPILHQKGGDSAKLLPPDDIRLQIGDRLIVLATIEGLRRVEQGAMTTRSWLVQVDKVSHPDAAFEGAMAIARVSGCDIGIARTLMNQLPATLQYPLYQHQAQRLVRELSKVQVRAYLQRFASDSHTFIE